MAKKKLKVKFVRFLLLFALLVLGFYLYFEIIGDDIKVIYVNNNNLVTDQQVIEQAGLSDYPSFFKTSKRQIIKKLRQNRFIKDVIVSKKIGKIIELDIKEYSILFKNSNNGKYVLENGKEYALDENYDVPILLNYVPNDIYKDLIKSMNDVNSIILTKMSEIKYSPNDYDDDLLIIYMNDKNVVQVTIDKLNSINKYNEIVAKLDGQNGILYLDSGNYFKIME